MAKGFDASSSSGRDAFDEGTVGVVNEACEDFFDFGKVLEGVEAVGALLELAGGLGAPEKENGENGAFGIGEVKDVGEFVLIFGGTSTEDFGDEVVFGEEADGFGDIVSGVVGDRVAGGALVAGCEEAVEGEGVEVRGGGFFF